MMPLSGKRVGILRKSEEMTKLVTLLQNEGAEVVPFPVMECVPDPRDNGALLKMLREGRGRIIILTSSFGVESLMGLVKESEFGLSILKNYQFLTVGEGTNESLKEFGMSADWVPAENSQNGIWKLIETEGLNHIIFPHAVTIRDFLENKMKEHRLDFASFIVYDNRAVGFSDLSAIEKLSEMDFLLFTSSRVVELLFKHPKIHQVSHWPLTLSLGNITEQTLEKLVQKIISETISKKNSSPLPGDEFVISLKNLLRRSRVAKSSSFKAMVKDLVSGER